MGGGFVKIEIAENGDETSFMSPTKAAVDDGVIPQPEVGNRPLRDR